MENAYSKNYLSQARTIMANLFDIFINEYNYSIIDFQNLLIKSKFAESLKDGDICYWCGKSSYEIALLMSEKLSFKELSKLAEKNAYNFSKSPEYWAGWALAFFQWKTNLSFQEIFKKVSIEEIISMYNPYHEMDISNFCIDIVKKYFMEEKK